MKHDTENILNPNFFKEILVLEKKSRNLPLKQKYLDEVVQDQLNSFMQQLKGKKSDLVQVKQHLQQQAFLAISSQIDKLNRIESFKIKEVEGHSIRGPMKWLVMILGPNFQAKNLKRLEEQKDLHNLNIIVVLLQNKQNTFSRQVSANPFRRGFTGLSKGSKFGSTAQVNFQNKRLIDPQKSENEGLNYYTKTLSNLVSSTQEGYMIKIEQNF